MSVCLFLKIFVCDALITMFITIVLQPCILNSSSIELQWVLDRSANVWHSSHDNLHAEEPHSESTFSKVDPWMQCIASFVSKEFAMSSCPLAIAHAWPIVYTRLNAVYTLLDPK